MVNEFYDYLLREFNKIFKDPIKRTNKWISTSIDPFSDIETVSWLEDTQIKNKKEKQTFAQYFANCILKPVLFKESCDKMLYDLNKQNNVNQVFVLEISPRSFLTSLMKSNTSKCKLITYLPGFSLVKKDKLYEKPNKNLLTLLNVIGTLNENGIYSSLSKLYQNNMNKLTNCHFLTNGNCLNGNKNNTSSNKKLKTKSFNSIQKLDYIPIITNHLPFSTFISWNHTSIFTVPAYPEHFSLSVDQNKIDFNSINYKHYLPDKTTKYRLPISFYIELILNQFKKLNSTIEFSTLHIQNLLIYRLEELDEKELEEIKIELIEFSEQSSLGQLYLFLVKNGKDELILKGNLAVSNDKYNQLVNEISNDGKKITNKEFYNELNLEEDHKQQLIEESLIISSQQINAKLNGDWIKQFDSLIQLYVFFNRKSLAAEIDKQTLQIHSIIIKLDDNYKMNDNNIWYNNEINLAQSKQVELKSIQLNSLDNDLNKITVDENSNIELKNKINVLTELNNYKLNVDYFKIKENQLNLQFANKQEIGFLDENDRFKEKNSWSLKQESSLLSYLSLMDGYLISLDLLYKKLKLNYKIQNSFLNLEQNLNLLIALCDLLTEDDDGDVYVLLNDKEKIDLINNCFSSRKNLHILKSTNLEDYDLEILNLTNGDGCEIVISNSLNKEQFDKSINCLSLNSKFVSINNSEVNVKNHQLGMSLFLKNIDFKSLTLDDINLDELVNDNLIKDKLQNKLNSLNLNIIKELDKLSQHDLEKLFNVNFISNYTPKIH